MAASFSLSLIIIAVSSLNVVNSQLACIDQYDDAKRCIFVSSQQLFPKSFAEAVDACTKLKVSDQEHSWRLPILSTNKKLQSFHEAMKSASLGSVRNAVFWIGMKRQEEKLVEGMSLAVWGLSTRWNWLDEETLNTSLENGLLDSPKWKRHPNDVMQDEPNNFAFWHGGKTTGENCVMGEWNQDDGVAWLDVPCDDDGKFHQNNGYMFTQPFDKFHVCESTTNRISAHTTTSSHTTAHTTTSFPATTHPLELTTSYPAPTHPLELTTSFPATTHPLELTTYPAPTHPLESTTSSTTHPPQLKSGNRPSENPDTTSGEIWPYILVGVTVLVLLICLILVLVIFRGRRSRKQRATRTATGDGSSSAPDSLSPFFQSTTSTRKKKKKCKLGKGINGKKSRPNPGNTTSRSKSGADSHGSIPQVIRKKSTRKAGKAIAGKKSRPHSGGTTAMTKCKISGIKAEKKKSRANVERKNKTAREKREEGG